MRKHKTTRNYGNEQELHPSVSVTIDKENLYCCAGLKEVQCCDNAKPNHKVTPIQGKKC